jgi:hypothetical protein
MKKGIELSGLAAHQLASWVLVYEMLSMPPQFAHRTPRSKRRLTRRRV